MKKILFIISFLGIFFVLTNSALASCTWRPLSVAIGNSQTGDDSDTTGGCFNNEKKRTASDTENCSGQQPNNQQETDRLTSYICCCGSDQAREVGPPLFKIPDFQIHIPGMEKLNKVECVLDGSGNYDCPVPWLGEYITGIYNYALAIAGILAALVLMAGGLIWLISGGDASKITQAKELIIGSITGLIILASSYVILIQINPNLVNFKLLSVRPINKLDFIENGSDSENNSAATRCFSEGNLVSINNMVNTSASDPRLIKGAADALKKAVDIAAKNNVKLYVTSANRTYAVQKKLWDAELKKHNGDETITRKYVAHPSKCQGVCYGHCASLAVDICIAGSTSCNHIGGSKNANYSDANTKKLEAIMIEAGWKRYSGEWWHFQYGLTP